MTDTGLPPGYLGPVTEARFAAAFADRAVVDKTVAADLIGVDPKSLDGLADEKIIRAVRRTRTNRGWTERDLRIYLLEGPDVEATGPKDKAKAVARTNVVAPDFTARRKKR